MGIVHAFGHSGQAYPQGFVETTKHSAFGLRSTEDAYVDQLVGFEEIGCGRHAGIACLVSRAFVDINRNPYELDPLLIQGRLPAHALVRSHNVRSGYGVVARCLGLNEPIYQGRLSLKTVLDRIEAVHVPYHKALRVLITRGKAKKARLLLLDWHSFPSRALKGHSYADIVLGDCQGQSCSPLTRERVKEAFVAKGLKVALNKPFSGGYTTQTYHDQKGGIETLQIEINRSLYMDEDSLLRSDNFIKLQSILMSIRSSL